MTSNAKYRRVQTMDNLTYGLSVRHQKVQVLSIICLLGGGMRRKVECTSNVRFTQSSRTERGSGQLILKASHVIRLSIN